MGAGWSWSSDAFIRQLQINYPEAPECGTADYCSNPEIHLIKNHNQYGILRGNICTLPGKCYRMLSE